jgi:hypothetical protein
VLAKGVLGIDDRQIAFKDFYALHFVGRCPYSVSSRLGADFALYANPARLVLGN